jgi:hypothetical protein
MLGCDSEHSTTNSKTQVFVIVDLIKDYLELFTQS